MTKAFSRLSPLEYGWLVPAVVLTLASTVLSLGLVPHADGLLPALRILPAWMAGGVLAGVIALFVTMVLEREASPIGAIAGLLRTERKRIAATLGILLIAGLNMIAFMWTKTLLNFLVPFWADPVLARLDALLFLGNDPWRFLEPLAFPAAGKIYHPVWFVTMIVLLVCAAWARPSPRRSAVLASYFILWSLVGPLVHCLLPAGGPVFYEALGYGPRFADIVPTPETQQVAGYLWQTYASGSFGAGSGISAMPSMHVTMAAWMVIAAGAVAPLLRTPVLLISALVAVLSVALGWHYALDGIVGGLLALLLYRALLALFSRERARPVVAVGSAA